MKMIFIYLFLGIIHFSLQKNEDEEYFQEFKEYLNSYLINIIICMGTQKKIKEYLNNSLK